MRKRFHRESYAEHEGKWDFVLNEKTLTNPLHARKPKVYFVCLNIDLFHKDVPDEFLIAIWSVMSQSPQHIFLILTKRPPLIGLLFGIYGSIEDRIYKADILPNAWLGVTVEHPDYLWRIDKLVKIPAAQYWLSLEPLLGPVTLPDKFLALGEKVWVVAGAETGQHARSAELDWFRSIRDQCQEVGVPFFLKQVNKKRERVLDGRTWDEVPTETKETP